MTENRHKRQTVSLEGADSGDAPAIVSRDCDYGGHKQLRIRFGHVPIRDLLDIEFRPMLRQNVAMAHVLGLACTKASMSCRKLRPSSTAVRCNPRGNRRRRGRGGMPWARRPSTCLAPPVLFRVREKRSAVAVGVGVSVPTDLEGGVPLGKPADAKVEHLIVGFAHRAPPLGAPSARLALRGFRRTSFHQRRERVGAPLGWGRRRPPCPSPPVMADQARAGGYNALTRGVSWSPTTKEPSLSPSEAPISRGSDT